MLEEIEILKLIEVYNEKFNRHRCDNDNTDIVSIRNDVNGINQRITFNRKYDNENRKREISFKPLDIHIALRDKGIKSIKTNSEDVNIIKEEVFELLNDNGIYLLSLDNFDFTFISSKGKKKSFKITIKASPFFAVNSTARLYVMSKVNDT